MIRPGARGTRLRDALWVGALCLLLGALGWTWELLAHQAPSSPWHVTGFATAIDRFAQHAWIEGLAIFALAPRAWRYAFGKHPARARAMLCALYTGTALTLGTLGYSSATGVLGLQIRDTGRSSHVLLALRLVGEGLLAAGLATAIIAALHDD